MDKKTEKGYQGKRIATPENVPVAAENAEQYIEQEIKPQKRKFWSDYGYLLITVVVVVVLFKVVFQLAFVPTGSMETTIPTNSFLIAWRLPYLMSDPSMERGDVTIFWDEEMGKVLVKRVVGLGGETVSFSNGNTQINGEKIDESYLPRQGITQCDEVFQVPADCLFMMGDNRTGSFDSRYLENPYIPLSAVQGRALVCVPLKQFTLFETDTFQGINIYLPLFGQTHTL